MKVGDIHWIELPTAGGHEQRGRRPAIIVQDERFEGNLPTVLVIPLTTTQRALRFAGTTLIKATQQNRLRADSVAMVFQLRAIDRNRIKAKIGKIGLQQRTALFAVLDKLIGRSS